MDKSILYKTAKNKNSAVFFTGESLIDGMPVIGIATGLKKPSINTKTGPMIQIYILRADTPPKEAADMGLDVSVFGNCQLRPIIAAVIAAKTGNDISECYVDKIRGPNAVWHSWNNGNIAFIKPAELADIIDDTGAAIRYGAYGDPAAIPNNIWYTLSKNNSIAATGYTHQWRSVDPRFRSICMASVDTPEQYHEARENGWRTFRTRHASMDLLEGEFICPASEEGGKRTACDRCGLGGGKGENDRRRSATIIAHGPTATRWAQAVGIEV